MQGSESSADEHPEEILNDASKFNNSLQELRDLRSQLHHAANYCETTFLNATEKKPVLESTKDYLCRAVVTVVDHLGSVSANLECQLSQCNDISETELRIDSLKQRLLTCQQYSHKLSLRRHCWIADFPKYCSRYLSPRNAPVELQNLINEAKGELKSTNGILRKSDGPIAAAAKTVRFEADEELPLFLYTYDCKQSLDEKSKLKNSSEKRSSSPAPVLPVQSGLSVVSKSHHMPCFQFQDSPKLKNETLNKRSVHNKDLMSLLRRGKRALTA